MIRQRKREEIIWNSMIDEKTKQLKKYINIWWIKKLQVEQDIIWKKKERKGEERQIKAKMEWAMKERKEERKKRKKENLRKVDVNHMFHTPFLLLLSVF